MKPQLRKETDFMSQEPSRGNPPFQTEAKGIRINAREFLEAFRDRPDDYYLMEKFSLKPKHLRKVYDQLMERGLLAEHEYCRRQKKSHEVEEKTGSGTTPPSVVSTPDSATEVTGTFTHYRSEFPSQPPAGSHLRTGTSTVVQVQTIELCPKCSSEKHPDYPDSCPYCGVVFDKIKESQKSGKVAVWVDKTGRFV